MEAFVDKAFNGEVRQAACTWLGSNSDTLELLGAVENYVYKFPHQGKQYILRFTHSSHRSFQQVSSELEWLAYLQQQEVSIAGPALNLADPPLLQIDASEGHFTAAVFHFAEGRLPKEEDYTPELLRSLGKMMGQMHRYTVEFKPSADFQRPVWDQSTYLDFEKCLTPFEPKIAELGIAHREHLKAHDTPGNAYGIIHSDIHQWNYFFDDGRIALFDFDDCEYNWFIQDLAMVVLYLRSFPGIEQGFEAQCPIIWKHLLEGYLPEYPLDKKWFQLIPPLLKIREYAQFSLLHLKWDINNLSEKQATVLQRFRENLSNNVPWVDVVSRVWE